MNPIRIYLSGPMRGVPDNNFPEFIRIAEILRAAGNDVLNPAESAIAERPTMIRSDYLRHDIQLILIVDAVVVIPSWMDSPGARFEVAEAWSIGIPVYFYRETASGFTLDHLEETSVVIPRENQYVNKTPLIGLSGYAGAGKDAIARVLVQEFEFTRVAFADPLKRIAAELGWDGTKNEYGRKLLQNLGVAVRDNLHSDAWVQAAEDSIERINGPIVMTDVRFPNEVSMVRRRGGTVVRVERPGTGAINDHISEHAIDGLQDEIFLNSGSLEDLSVQVRLWVSSLTKGLVHV